MRWLLAALLLLPFSFALESTNFAGEHPVIYGSFIAYENNNSVYVYNLQSKQNTFVARGAHPSIFGYTLVFDVQEVEDINGDGDTADSIVYYYKINDKTLEVAGVGRHPFVFSNLIVFSSKESELGVDFSNNGGLEDDIIRGFDLSNKELINFKAVGDYPVATKSSIAFLTKEDQHGFDLTADDDKADTVLRVLDIQTRGVDNTRILATPLLLSKGTAVFSTDKIYIFDMKEQKVRGLPVNGNHPGVYEDKVVFERDGNLYAYDLETLQAAPLDIKGVEPVLFEGTIAFSSSESVLGDLNGNGLEESIIRYSIEDFDHLPYEDCDSAGDSCAGLNAKPRKAKEKKSDVVSGEEITTPAEREPTYPWYYYALGILIAIVILPPLSYYGYKYYKKRQKSFGF